MIDFSSALQRASLFGLAALAAVLLLQWLLSDRVPARWRVWIWRVALIQTALLLVPLAPIALAILPARAPASAPKTVRAPTIQTAAIQTPEPASAINGAPAVIASSDSEIAPAQSAPPAIAESPNAPNAPNAPVTPNAPVAGASYGFGARLSWRDLAVWTYGFGIALQLALLARNVFRVRRALRACAPLDNAVLRPIAERLNIRELPRLLESASGSPFLVGFLRPTIVVPQCLSEAHLEAVFAHELAHHKRRDLLWNALLWALQTALWFHPLSWLSRRFHALEVESACDELTLQLTQIAPKSYGALLIGAENLQTSPLTAGVNDGFFALQTRLKRLARAPVRPRRRARALFLAALLISFAAVVPLRLTARAQNEAQPATRDATRTQSLHGTVRDFDGNAVANATVYIMEPMDDGGIPRAQTRTDSKGRFALDKLNIDEYGVVVFVDAGQRGITEKQFDLNTSDDADNLAIGLPHRSFVALLLRGPKQKPIKGVEVRLSRVGNSANSWMAMPRAVSLRYRAISDEAGIAKFPPLPLGMLAQFVLADQISKPTKFGLGDLRGGKFAPLAAENALRLNRQGVLQSIDLVPSIRLEGRVTSPSGQPKGNVLILARRINAAEAAGDDENRERIIAQTRSNATGKYVMDGLRPGRYYVWVYPEKPLVKEFVGAVYIRDLKAPVNRVNFQLSRGAVIQGVVISQTTKQPVKGQTMWLFDSQENNQYAITDARGTFKFRAMGGKQRLRVHKNGSNSPPPGFRLPAQSEFNFTVKNGEKRDFKIELLGARLTKPTAGVVVGPDEKLVANARVVYRMAGSSIDNQLHFALTDANGRFALPMKWSVVPAQLWADKGELTTQHATIAASGGTVKLRLQQGAWARVSGRVRDDKNRPVAGARVSLYQNIDGNGISPTFAAASDANGSYAFEHLRPDLSANVTAIKKGYTHNSMQEVEMLQSGQNRAFDVSLLRAEQTLSGRVLAEDGAPARGYQVWANGSLSRRFTDKNGQFSLANLLDEALLIWVSSPRNERTWQARGTQGGDKNVSIRLSQKIRFSTDAAIAPVAPPIKGATRQLIGRNAPAIRAIQWSNGKALSLSSLRGQKVLLAFDPFIFDGNGQLRDFARSFRGRIAVLGVQQSHPASADPRFQKGLNQVAKDLGFPIAVDAALTAKNKRGGQTFAAYGNAPYVTIGRDGRVLYAGDQLDRALAFATSDE